MEIEETNSDDPRIPKNLLRLADPSDESIEQYLKASRIFLGLLEGKSIAVAAVRVRERKAELLNLAVSEEFQQNGFGSRMLTFVKDTIRLDGINSLEVGTGNSSLGPLSFYQKNGFRIVGIRKNYFQKYHPPIYENNIRCIDMIVLSISLTV